MKRPIAITLFAIILVSTFLLSYKHPVEPLSLEVLLGKETPILTELGIPSEQSYSERLVNSRNPWDMAVFDGKLYVGCGDYGQNTGPCNVWQYDPVCDEWSSSGTVNDEAVANFEILDDKLVITGTDPKEGWEYGSFYTYTPDGWQTDRTVPFGAHMFDIAKFKGQTFYGIGNAKYTQSPVQMTVNGTDYVNVQFYIGDEVLVGNPDYGYSRCYNLFESIDELYAFCWWSNSQNGKQLYSFFKYDGQAFRLVSHIQDLNVKSVASNRQVLLTKALCFNGKYYFALGSLYSTNNFKKVDMINVPQDAIVQDMTVQNGRLYVLTSRKIETGTEADAAQPQNNTVYENSILELSEQDSFSEIYSFQYKTSAMSFEKDGDTYYIGLGQKTDGVIQPTVADSPVLLNGTILKLEFVR